MICPFTVLTHLITTRFGGVLTRGVHTPDGSACLLEAAHAAVGDPWSDTPDRWPDLRELNDAFGANDAIRTAVLLPVLAAYWDWDTWQPAKQKRVIAHVVALTVQRLIAELPNLPEDVRLTCRTVQTTEAAEAAARAARAAGWAAGAAGWTAWGTEAAARAAGWAAWAAGAAEAAGWAAWGTEAAARAAGWAAEAAARAAEAAARAARTTEAAEAAARAAEAAGWAAGAAGWTAGWTAKETVLRQACQLWIEASQIESQEALV